MSIEDATEDYPWREDDSPDHLFICSNYDKCPDRNRPDIPDNWAGHYCSGVNLQHIYYVLDSVSVFNGRQLLTASANCFLNMYDYVDLIPIEELYRARKEAKNANESAV